MSDAAAPAEEKDLQPVGDADEDAAVFALHLDETVTYDYSEDSFMLKLQFSPEEDGTYALRAAFSAGVYEISCNIESGAEIESGGSQYSWNHPDDVDYVTLFPAQPLKAGRNYTLALTCTAYTGAEGTASFTLSKSGEPRVALAAGQATVVDVSSCYTFTAEEDGVYKFDVSSQQIAHDPDSLNPFGYVTVYTKDHSYMTEDFVPTSSRSTDRFVMYKGETAILDYYYNGDASFVEVKVTPVKTNAFFVTWDAGEGEIATDYNFSVYGKTKCTERDIYTPGAGDMLRDYYGSEWMRCEGRVFLGWTIGDTDEMLSDERDFNTNNYKYRVKSNVVFHAKWSSLVPVAFHANGETFSLPDGDTWPKPYASDDDTVITMKGVAGEPLKSGVRLDNGNIDYNYYWFPSCTKEDYAFETWSLDPEGNVKVKYSYTEDAYVYTSNSSNQVIIPAEGLTLYAQWAYTGPEYPEAFSITVLSNEAAEPGKEMTYSLFIENVTDMDLTPDLSVTYMPSLSSQDSPSNVPFGVIEGDGYDAATGTVSLAAGETAMLTLAGTIPDDWGSASALVIEAEDADKHCSGRLEYKGGARKAVCEFDEGYGGIAMDGEIGVELPVSVKASCLGAATIKYQWSVNGREYGDTHVLQSETLNAGEISTCTLVPARKLYSVRVQATAYDANGEEIDWCSCLIDVMCENDACVTNPENHLKIANGGSRELTVETANTHGELLYYWSWRRASEEAAGINLMTMLMDEGPSLIVRDYDDTDIIYECSVSDAQGYVGNARFIFEFCEEHTGEWVVTKPATTGEEGEESLICSE